MRLLPSSGHLWYLLRLNLALSGLQLHANPFLHQTFTKQNEERFINFLHLEFCLYIYTDFVTFFIKKDIQKLNLDSNLLKTFEYNCEC